MRLWGPVPDIDGDLMLCCVEGVLHKGVFFLTVSSANSPPCPHLLVGFDTQAVGHFQSRVYVIEVLEV